MKRQIIQFFWGVMAQLAVTPAFSTSRHSKEWELKPKTVSLEMPHVMPSSGVFGKRFSGWRSDMPIGAKLECIQAPSPTSC